MWCSRGLSRNLYENFGVFKLDIGQYAIKTNPNSSIKLSLAIQSYGFDIYFQLMGDKEKKFNIFSPSIFSPAVDDEKEHISPLFAVHI